MSISRGLRFGQSGRRLQQDDALQLRVENAADGGALGEEQRSADIRMRRGTDETGRAVESLLVNDSLSALKCYSRRRLTQETPNGGSGEETKDIDRSLASARCDWRGAMIVTTLRITPVCRRWRPAHVADDL